MGMAFGGSETMTVTIAARSDVSARALIAPKVTGRGETSKSTNTACRTSAPSFW